MFKRITKVIFALLLALGLSGCAAAMILMAENAESKQTFDISYGQAVDIVKCAIIKQGVVFKEASLKDRVAEVKGSYQDERTARIFIYKINEKQCSIAVRVGTSDAGKKDAEEILTAVKDCARQQ